MSKTKVAINGFGRIGRLALRRILERDDIEVALINDLADNEPLAYLFRRDSVHGTYRGAVSADSESITIDGTKIPMTEHRDPAECAWGDRGIDIVLDCTGVFTKREMAQKHLDAGAKKVLISAPAKGEDKTFVIGVNEGEYDPDAHHIISNASCTTNCVAPPLKALHDAFGVEYGVLNTIHAYTISQGLLDSPQKKDWRRGRAAALNLVPTTTGAAKAVGSVLPELKGKLDGFAIRVPVPTGSMGDLTLTLGKDASVDEVHAALRAHAEKYPSVLEVSTDKLVSTDIIGDTHSSIVDADMTMKVGPMVKLICWYDNEAGYATRLVDLAGLVASKL